MIIVECSFYLYGEYLSDKRRIYIKEVRFGNKKIYRENEINNQVIKPGKKKQLKIEYKANY